MIRTSLAPIALCLIALPAGAQQFGVQVQGARAGKLQVDAPPAPKTSAGIGPSTSSPAGPMKPGGNLGSGKDASQLTVLFDLGPEILPSAPTPKGIAQSYGKALEGSAGMPALSAIGAIEPGSSIQLMVENSSAVDTFGYLRAGYREIELELRNGAVLVCDASIALRRVKLPAGTAAIDFDIPAEALVDGLDVCAQVVIADPGAKGGFSVTQGLKLSL